MTLTFTETNSADVPVTVADYSGSFTIDDLGSERFGLLSDRIGDTHAGDRATGSVADADGNLDAERARHPRARTRRDTQIPRKV